MKWISVKDRLPEKKQNNFSEYVIVHDPDGYIDKDKYDYFLKDWHYSQPTHWMPLPDPPKE